MYSLSAFNESLVLSNRVFSRAANATTDATDPEAQNSSSRVMEPPVMIPPVMEPLVVEPPSRPRKQAPSPSPSPHAVFSPRHMRPSRKDAPAKSLSNDAVTSANSDGHQSILEIKTNMNRHSGNILASRKDAPSKSLSNGAVTSANSHGHQSILEIKANMNSHRTILAGDHPSPDTRRDSLPYSLPGSYAVSGPDDHTEVSSEDQDAFEADSIIEEKDYMSSVDPILLDAELVDPAEREQERDRIRNEALEEIQASAAMAEIVDDSAEKRLKRNMRLLLSITFISLIVAIIVAVVMFKTRETQNRTALGRDEAVRIAIQNEFGEDTNLADEYSPQYAAYDWMVNNDTISPDDRLFSQRFAMCVLAFATNIDGWHGGRSKWLGNNSECSWSRLTCNGQGRLSAISLGKSQSKLESHDAFANSRNLTNVFCC
jgi:hypothetical protein